MDRLLNSGVLFVEGFSACQLGLNPSDNPYEQDSRYGKTWAIGYQAASRINNASQYQGTSNCFQLRGTLDKN